MRTYSEYVTYFEKVARNHLEIAHTDNARRFFPIDLAELVNHLQSFEGMPAMGLERPFWSTAGQFANIRLRKTGALMIFDRCHDPMDFTKLEEVYSRCFKICNDIRAKMVKDAKLWDEDLLDFIIPGLDPGSFTMEPMPPGVAKDSTIYGVRLSFVFDEGAEIFDPVKWNEDESDYD